MATAGIDDRCAHCDGATRLAFNTKDRNRRITASRFDYRRCLRCGLISLARVPSDLGRYYPQDYYSVPAGSADLRKAADLETFKLDLLKGHMSSGRVLEIGPAYGSFCLLARDAGFEVEALEMDPECCRFIRDEIGIRVIESDDVRVSLTAEDSYDAIVLWHVVEHLRAPWEDLASIADHLSPGGLLILAAPNPGAIQFRLFRGFWTHVDAPRHIHLIPSDWLISLGERLGLEPVALTSTDPGGIGWNRFGWQMTLANLVARHRTKRLAMAIGSALHLLATPIERTGGRGSTYTLILRKAAA